MSDQQQPQTFTQEQVNELIEKARQEWMEKELNPVIAERDELLKYKPEPVDEKELEHQKKMKELFLKECELELIFAGLDDFKEFITADSIEELKEKIEKFQKILNERKIKSSFKPENHRQTDQYSKYEQEKNTVGMISAKLAKIFK